MKTNFITTIIALLFFTSFSTIAVAQSNCTPVWGQDSVKATQEISLYREFFKQNNFKDAATHWRYVFFNAPGARQTTHLDGVKIFKSFADAEKDAAKKAKYVDTVLMVFDKRLECFGMDGDVLGRKGVEMVTYQKDEKTTYEVFKKAAELEQNKMAAFILYYYVFAANNAYKKNIITAEELMEIYGKATGIIETNVKNAGKGFEKYAETQGTIDELISASGILNCDNLKEIYTKQYKENPEDKALWTKIYNQMRAAKCADDPIFIEVTEKLFQTEPDETKARVLAYAYIGNKNYSKAVTYFKAAAEQSGENDKKAEYFLKVSELQQTLGDFESSRNSSQKAASLKPGWGEPYLQIGDLYASSGSKCGTGTGFESQVVVWAAIDMYEKAKSVDGSVSGKANNKIANYSKYMPSKSECFFRGLKEGDSFKITCWIGETTKVRYGPEQ